MEVIVLGLGTMGAAACYHLAKRGVRVLGIEQFGLAHDRGGSHGETRVIRRAYFENPDYVPLLNRAFQLWEELEAESGESIFVRNGLAIYGDPETSIVYQGTMKSARLYGIPMEELTAEAARNRFPMYQPPDGARLAFEPGAGFLHAETAVKAHARLAAENGAVLRTGEKVLEYSDDGDRVRVLTDVGEYTADRLLVTGGSWNVELLRDLRLPLSIHRVFLYWFEAGFEHELRGKPDGPGHGAREWPPCFLFDLGKEFFYGFPMFDGRTVKIAAHYAKDLILHPEEKEASHVPQERLEAVTACVRKHLPFMSDKLSRFATCIYTITPDQDFVLDVHPVKKNISFAGGFSGHGFKFSSVIGEILADLATKGKTDHPIGFLSLSRFR